MSARDLAEVLRGFAADFKAENDAATQEARDREALAAMLKRYGACNTVSMLSDACYDLNADTDIADWNTAGVALSDAADAVNLTYEADESATRETPVPVRDFLPRGEMRRG